MKLHLIFTWLFVGLFNFVLALPATSIPPMTPHPTNTDGDTYGTLAINGTAALESGVIQRDPATGWCNLNIGLIEHFPRGGLWNGKGKDINWEWDDGTPPMTNGRPTERRIDYGPFRIFDFLHRGDSLSFSWYHPDNNIPSYVDGL